ncbi:hypothetical protein [Pelosinus fermentans]|uniref:Outer membrane protein beta-barrel domain-containing protein n=1 Tax=Pelosinus fermentans JBW45 TaxID=1192197 RepID=I9DA96_9FIRM|nr:hypothetical protein [Pelosinus fermentans]AJQ25466.1 hypothetical protein JBW_00114 [Pelosinus fermentans JBW45]
MKKIIITFISFLLLNMNNVFATPINDLEREDTAVGVISGSKNSMYYIEMQTTDNLILGISYRDLRDDKSATDYYAQIRTDNETLRVIIGNRISDSHSKGYLGGAVQRELADDLEGYASLIAGNGLQELQLGANYRLTDTSDLNINLSTLSGNKSSIGIGVSCKF